MQTTAKRIIYSFDIPNSSWKRNVNLVRHVANMYVNTLDDLLPAPHENEFINEYKTRANKLITPKGFDNKQTATLREAIGVYIPIAKKTDLDEKMILSAIFDTDNSFIELGATAQYSNEASNIASILSKKLSEDRKSVV